MLVCKLCNFKGSWTIIAKKPYIFVIFQGWVRNLCPHPTPNGSAHAIQVTIVENFDKYILEHSVSVRVVTDYLLWSGVAGATVDSFGKEFFLFCIQWSDIVKLFK